MRKGKKMWLAVAGSLVVIGLIIFVGTMAVNGWDFRKLGTGKYETNTYVISEEFSNISIKTNTADVVFAPSDDGKFKVVCYEENKVKHSVRVENEALTINVVDTRKWYEHIGFNFRSPRITVYLPEGEYGSLKINESTGDIVLAKDFSFASIDISVSTGDVKCLASSSGDVKIGVSTGEVKLSGVSCKSFTSKGSTGDISLNNVVVAEKISIERSTGDVELDRTRASKIFIETDTGDVELERSDAGEISIETDTGDVEGTLLSDKVFITETDTGRVNVPSSVTGGRCEITTDTGDIRISIIKG